MSDLTERISNAIEAEAYTDPEEGHRIVLLSEAIEAACREAAAALAQMERENLELKRSCFNRDAAEIVKLDHALQQTEAERDALQQRVDKAVKGLREWLDCRDDHPSLQHVLAWLTAPAGEEPR